MADFNAARLTFPTTATPVGGLLDAGYNETGADIELTSTTMTLGQGRPGITHKELTCTVLGHATGLSRGSTGSVRVIFGTTADNDGIDLLPSVYLSDKSKSGSLDNAVTTALTFRPWKSS